MTKLERILHVDDDEDIRAVTLVALRVIGSFDVRQFSGGRDAVRNAPAFAPQLCLLDVMMPEMSGEETWAQLKALPGMENVPFVFMTAKAEQSFAQSLLDQGALGVIIKPFDPVTLCARITEIWQGRPSETAAA